LESTQKHFWLIFNKWVMFKKALLCYFYHINSTNNFEVRPVGLDRAFHKLFKYIKFIKFGLVDLFLLNFESSSSIEFEFKRNKRIQILARAGKVSRPKGRKTTGPAQLRVWRERAA
jgi:hypothetical protein